MQINLFSSHLFPADFQCVFYPCPTSIQFLLLILWCWRTVVVPLSLKIQNLGLTTGSKMQSICLMHWPHSLKREKNNLLCGYLSQRIGFSKPCCWRLERHCHGRTKGSLETHRMHYLQVLYTLTELLGTTPVFITFLFCSYIFFFLSYLVSYFS